MAIFAPAALASMPQITGTESGVVQLIAIGECRNDGGSCEVASGKTINSEVDASGGVDVKAFSATFGTSYGESYMVTTGCQKYAMEKARFL